MSRSDQCCEEVQCCRGLSGETLCEQGPRGGKSITNFVLELVPVVVILFALWNISRGWYWRIYVNFSDMSRWVRFHQGLTLYCIGYPMHCVCR